MKKLQDVKMELNEETNIKQGKLFFENGYGISIIQGGFSYTSNENEYEIAILKGDENNWELNYETPIASDVIGYLDENQVNQYIEKVSKLPSCKFF